MILRHNNVPCGDRFLGTLLHGKRPGTSLRCHTEKMSARRLRRPGAIRRENSRYVLVRPGIKKKHFG